MRAEDKGNWFARAKAGTGGATPSQVDSLALGAAAWLNGPDMFGTAAGVRNDAWSMVVTSIEGALQGPALQAPGIAAGFARRCLVADRMA